MDKELKDKWVKALRSGEYKQGVAHLVNENDQGHYKSYCCLGVLCKIKGYKDDQFELYNTLTEFVENSDLFPANEIINTVLEEFGISEKDQDILVTMNDGDNREDVPPQRRHSFNEIADWIERNL